MLDRIFDNIILKSKFGKYGVLVSPPWESFYTKSMGAIWSPSNARKWISYTYGLGDDATHELITRFDDYIKKNEDESGGVIVLKIINDMVDSTDMEDGLILYPFIEYMDIKRYKLVTHWTSLGTSKLEGKFNDYAFSMLNKYGFEKTSQIIRLVELMYDDYVRGVADKFSLTGSPHLKYLKETTQPSDIISESMTPKEKYHRYIVNDLLKKTEYRLFFPTSVFLYGVNIIWVIRDDISPTVAVKGAKEGKAMFAMLYPVIREIKEKYGTSDDDLVRVWGLYSKKVKQYIDKNRKRLF